MQFAWSFRLEPAWPALSWVAVVSPESSEISVHAGSGVEQHQTWFCEAVWDGPFAEGGFDCSDNVAGSGGRLREGAAVFVSASNTLDRLVHATVKGQTFVSNSFSALLGYCGLAADPTRSDYGFALASIVSGRDRYERTIEVGGIPVALTYVANLRWDGRILKEFEKPMIRRDFSTFESYRDFLGSSMAAVVGNARDAARARPLEPLVGLSVGYDSPAIAVLAREAGVREAFSITRDREGEGDSGRRIGERLGYVVRDLPRNQWRERTLPELECLAGSGGAGEVAMLGDPGLLADRLILTGFHGGVTWGLDPKKWCSDLRRIDGSGLCFTEARLGLGFEQSAVPFWGVSQGREVIALARSEAMTAWNVPGRYSRPIPRRIVETAGIPRQWFGTSKHGVSDQLLSASQRLSASTEKAYRRWARQHTAAWLKRGRLPPWLGPGLARDTLACRFLVPALRKIARGLDALGLTALATHLRSAASGLRGKLRGYRLYATTWALMECRAKYAAAPQPGRIDESPARTRRQESN